MADLLARALVEAAPTHNFFLYHQFGRWLSWNTVWGTHITAKNVREPFRWTIPPVAKRIWDRVGEGKVGLPGDPDIVHANSFQAPEVGRARLIYTVYDVSFWVHPEFSTEENRVWCERGTKQAFENGAGLLFISRSTLTEAARLFPDLLKRKGLSFAVAPLASRFARAAAPRLDDQPGDWLAVGSLEPRKNYECLLSALELYWSASRHPRKLLIAGGKGWKSEQLRRRIAHLQSRGIVRYLGYVSDETLLELYRGSFALVFPSHYEGFGLPVVEAFSQACPVITRAESSLGEIGGSAAVYTGNDPEQIAQAMLRLEQDPEHYREVSQASLEQARNFSWEKTAQTVLELYERVMDS